MRRSRWGDWVEPDRSPLVLVPIFGCKTFGANTTCDDVHHGPMPEGTNCCCMVCYQSGREDHPALKETVVGALALKNWRPTDEQGNPTRDQWSKGDTAEPTVYDGPPKPGAEKTRRERRAERYGHDAVVVPMNPDVLARRLDAGRARTIAQ